MVSPEAGLRLAGRGDHDRADAQSLASAAQNSGPSANRTLVPAAVTVSVIDVIANQLGPQVSDPARAA
ncbi:hypothetical protein E3T55_12830 [Cryobacterium frigoriphilum]|uniref:Uncharacterized protein n=1 Tax=Cryobacterium frigoriphilum TaxID=1259150 RepID=A0A4R8ZYN2_9MICO|nr:hypothetical protein [Cryobacterium frigoriphilum]TFD48922.1 hypothetical protein E3T55_12830 [Cryobacterium frigoriphilum]